VTSQLPDRAPCSKSDGVIRLLVLFAADVGTTEAAAGAGGAAGGAGAGAAAGGARAEEAAPAD
jgi:hypothetical protein